VTFDFVIYLKIPKKSQKWITKVAEKGITRYSMS